MRVTLKTGGGEIADDHTLTIVQGLNPVGAEIQLADHGFARSPRADRRRRRHRKEGDVPLVQSYMY